MIARGRLPLLLAALGFGACATDTIEYRGPVVRDSAGVRIVESDAPGWPVGAVWGVGNVPATQIGTPDGAEHDELAQVAGAVRLANGNIVVANGASRQLRFFSEDGRFIQSVGRQGMGPGEFRALSRIWRWPGDSVAIWDAGQVRLSIYSASGELGRVRNYVRGASLAPGVSGAPRATPKPVGSFADGSLVAHFGVMRRSPAGQMPRTMYRDSVHFRRFSVDGSAGEPVASVLGDEWFFHSWRGSVTNAEHPFGKKMSTAATGDRFYYSPGGAYEIRVYASTGDLVEIIRRNTSPPLFTTEAIESYKDRSMEDAPPGGERAWRDWLDHEFPFPDTLPAFSRLLVDLEENVWAQRFQPPADSTPHWTVFAVDGRLLGDVTLPDRFDAVEIGTDYVLGVWRDESDVEHVRLYDLIKPEG